MLHIFIKILVEGKRARVRGFGFMEPLQYLRQYARHAGQTLLLDAWKPRVYLRCVQGGGRGMARHGRVCTARHSTARHGKPCWAHGAVWGLSGGQVMMVTPGGGGSTLFGRGAREASGVRASGMGVDKGAGG